MLLLLLAASLAWLAWRAPLVDAVTVRAAPLLRSVQFSARVAALTRVDVGSTLTARVAQVLVRQGQIVRQGEPLVRLEADEWRAALTQAQAAQTQAAARLAGLRSSGRAQAQAALQQAQATVLAAQVDVARTRQLVEQQFLSPARLDEAQRALSVAQAAQAAATAQVQANAETGSDTAQAQAQWVAAVASTQAAQARLAQTVLRAPASAQVLARLVEPGQIVQPGRALLSLALQGPTQLKAQVDERFLAQLAIGQRASVVADAFAQQRLAARVTEIAPAVDAQRGAVEVTLALEDAPPDFLREDMTLSVEVQTARRAQVLSVPLSALRGAAAPGDDAASVWVAVDGRAQARALRLGLRNLQAAEVLSGLQPGDAVLLGDGVRLGQRLRVRPVPADALTATVLPAGNGGAGDASALSNAMGR